MHHGVLYISVCPISCIKLVIILKYPVINSKKCSVIDSSLVIKVKQQKIQICKLHIKLHKKPYTVLISGTMP